jgi:hypothetical protein
MASQQTVKWAGTGLCLVGIGLTSFNIYPANIVLGLVGSGLWAVAGWMQRDTPLVLVEAAAAAMYAAGVIAFLRYL